MGNCIIVMNGGGGVSSDELTAKATWVLSGAKYVGVDTDDDIGTGTMRNNGAVSKTITPSASAQSYTIPAGYHNGSGKVNVSAITNPVWTGWKQVCSLTAQKVNFDDAEKSVYYNLDTTLKTYNTFIFKVVYGTNSSTSTPSKLYQGTFIACRKADDTASHTITPTNTRNSYTEVRHSDVLYSVGVDSDCSQVEVLITYDGESETTTKYAWFEVVLIAALKL